MDLVRGVRDGVPGALRVEPRLRGRAEPEAGAAADAEGGEPPWPTSTRDVAPAAGPGGCRGAQAAAFAEAMATAAADAGSR